MGGQLAGGRPLWTRLGPGSGASPGVNVRSRRHIQDPASQRLTWNKCPKSVLVIKKIRDASLLQPFKELCMYLMEASRRVGRVAPTPLHPPPSQPGAQGGCGQQASPRQWAP